jgi:hypothetical protein
MMQEEADELQRFTGEMGQFRFARAAGRPQSCNIKISMSLVAANSRINVRAVAS